MAASAFPLAPKCAVAHAVAQSPMASLKPGQPPRRLPYGGKKEINKEKYLIATPSHPQAISG